jgi:CubicO group peptidase (beta-lactamase class C family)
VKDDKLAFERYSGALDRDYNYELYSITKGVTALVAGMLIDEGRLRLDDKVGDRIAKSRPDLAENAEGVHWQVLSYALRESEAESSD